MSRPNPIRKSGAAEGRRMNILHERSGFTLIELVLATFISSLVIGIMAICLSFTLRSWEREQNRTYSDMPALIHLLKLQLACFDPMAVTIDGQKGIFFEGDERSLAFCTDHSVRAITRGAPVIARYVFFPEEKKLYYAEIPADPYHSESVTEFLQMEPRKAEKSGLKFHAVDVANFELTYTGEDKGGGGAWSDLFSIPKSVVVTWVTGDGSAPYSTFLIPNCLFSRSMPKLPGMLQAPGLKQQQKQRKGS
ncbi:MAG: prepilin-type N-terminal cleavage/methylation domain-containing protein [Desulfobacteraceae bacterium]|nr:prepilin-type N-terminal cleavage/methylation domain-containing protein [Desulfobacteraceae bacterium]